MSDVKSETPFSFGVTTKERVCIGIPNPRSAYITGNLDFVELSDGGNLARTNPDPSKDSFVSLILDTEQAVDLLDILVKRIRIHDKHPEVDVFKAGYRP